MVKVTADRGSTKSVACVGLATMMAQRLFSTSCGFALPRRPVLNDEVKFQDLTVRSLRERLQALELPRSGSGDLLRLRLAGAEHRVEATALSKRRQQRVRWAQEQNYWNMSRRGWYVRPPPSLGRGSRNPLCELGECGDTACALYRFRAGCEGVRSDFVNFCAEQIEEHFWKVKSRHDEGLVYCTLGCGCLYFDWELLNRLSTSARFPIHQVWVVDRAFWKNATVASDEFKALNAFSQWFAGTFDLHAFRTVRSLKRWCSAFSGQFGRAHVVMECDSVQTHALTDDSSFCRSVLHEEALSLQIFSQRLARRRPGPGRRRAPVPVAPVRCVRRRKEDSLETLQRDQWTSGAWTPDYLIDFMQEDGLQDPADWIAEDLQRRYR
ncbi:unnamed protein product [Symbiodinium sp. CCMP2592]|nr:unnamed protein product [Symbiodinium sp. CCMP2592]